ncbi:unnamed protein product [Schistosoma margrebowiei]|uniref:Uncharacterized protein n=1 Tax=Schistosoma margrebowiei TaxID=48269 RepID=A0A183MSE7_9TREM|nr:unnamed protein product [Schistosoma margrebowiei]
MRTSISENKHGIKWTARTQLDDVDVANDLALLSHTQHVGENDQYSSRSSRSQHTQRDKQDYPTKHSMQ